MVFEGDLLISPTARPEEFPVIASPALGWAWLSHHSGRSGFHVAQKRTAQRLPSMSSSSLEDWGLLPGLSHAGCQCKQEPQSMCPALKLRVRMGRTQPHKGKGGVQTGSTEALINNFLKTGPFLKPLDTTTLPWSIPSWLQLQFLCSACHSHAFLSQWMPILCLHGCLLSFSLFHPWLPCQAGCSSPECTKSQNHAISFPQTIFPSHP